jgi:transcriptional regulator with XRE-family HTH domain
MSRQLFQTRIIEARAQQKMTRNALARRAGISQGQMWKMENQPDANPTLRYLEKVAVALKIQVIKLLS